jgi:thiamine-monophosphate kinase
MLPKEDEITAYLQEIFRTTYNEETLLGVGDDCAVIAAPSNNFVVSTDILVEDVHFKTAWSSPEDIAQRAFAQNFADIAAQGARGVALVVSLAVPKDCELEWLQDFAGALAETAREQGVAVVGGDLSSSAQIVVNITAFGALDGREPVLRSTAQVGDVVAICGELGLSARGFEILSTSTDAADAADAAVAADAGERGTTGAADGRVASHATGAGGLQAALQAALQAFAIQRYLVPEPQYAEGVWAAENGATAMMDISDGLLKDAQRLAKSSGVSIELEELEELEAVAEGAGAQAQALAYYYLGGEDHALLATFPRGTTLNSKWQVIGRVIEQGEHLVIGQDLEKLENQEVWDHF